MALISTVSITGNVLTVVTTTPHNFLPGQGVGFTGVAPATFLSGVAVTVLPTGITGTQFTANFTHANYPSTVQTSGTTQPVFILACKELNGGIYITRLPKATVNLDGSVQPGVPDAWFFVGPGTNPSITEYSGTKFALMFTYLSHLNVRIVDIATWPPTEVIPITNPPTITIGSQTTGSGAPQDSLTLKTESGIDFGLTQQFFKPPLITKPLLFLDPITHTYSVTITPLSGWAPDPPVSLVNQVFYRFYVRPFPYTGPWLLTTDWTLTNPSPPQFSFPFSNVGSMRFQFSVTWGTQFNATDQWNTNAHAEGIPGQYFVTVDSTTQQANAQAFINEHLTLDITSLETFVIMAPRQEFLVQAATDSLDFGQRAGTGFSVPLVGDVTLAPIMGARAGFIQPSALADSIDFSKAYQQGNTLQAVMG